MQRHTWRNMHTQRNMHTYRDTKRNMKTHTDTNIVKHVHAYSIAKHMH